MKAATKPTSHGCIGLGKRLEVCCDVYDGKVDIYMNILGQRVAGRSIDSNGTTQDYAANIGFAKVSGSYRVDWNKKTVSVKGKACYWKVVKWVAYPTAKLSYLGSFAIFSIKVSIFKIDTKFLSNMGM